MERFSPDDTPSLIAAANAARVLRGGMPREAREAGAEAERRLDVLFGARRILAVYGTLAPGRPNHHVVAPLGGEWTTGVVEGELSADGWGMTYGFPGLRPRPGAGDVPVHVLTSPVLEAAWPELDAFEGPAYARILVPVFRGGPGPARALVTVANLYAVAEREALTPRE